MMMMNMVQDTITQDLSNGIRVRGCFRYTLAGTEFDLFIVAPDTTLLSRTTITKKEHIADAVAVLKHEVNRIKAALLLYKAETLTHLPVQVAAADFVLRVLYPRRNGLKAA